MQDGSSRERRFANNAIGRLLATTRGDEKGVHRIQDVLTQPFKGRHITNFVSGSKFVDGMPLFDAIVYWRVKQEGLRISTGGQVAIYGDGAYCFSIRQEPPARHHFFIDVLIPPGTAIEQISVPGHSAYYYRLMPTVGDYIRNVRIINTNIDDASLSAAEKFL